MSGLAGGRSGAVVEIGTALLLECYAALASGDEWFVIVATLIACLNISGGHLQGFDFDVVFFDRERIEGSATLD